MFKDLLEAEKNVFKPRSEEDIAKAQADKKAKAMKIAKEKGMFMCPGCFEPLDHVRVYSEAYQKANLKGNQITDYGSVEELTDTTGIECPYCGENLMDEIEQ